MSVIQVISLTILTFSSVFSKVTRIVNGTDAEVGEFPFIVSLRNINGAHMCGGSIISDQWILTAAHCVEWENPFSINIQFGTTDISQSGKNVAAVKKITVHNEYNASKHFINDIALLQLYCPLLFDHLTSSVKLPKEGQITPDGSSATLIGWGRNATDGFRPKHLQKVNLITFSDHDCSNRYNYSTHPSNICAGVPEGYKGQCNGDSGGPLLVDGEQVGIVSWSIKPCARPGYPGVLIKVSSYINWILSQTGLKFQ